MNFSSIQTSVSAKVAELSGFKELFSLPDYFGRAKNTIAHKGFVVGLQNTTETNERQRRSVGVYVQTSVFIKFAYRLRPTDAYPTDYNNALDTEITVINKALESYATSAAKLQIRYLSSNREATSSNEYMIHTLDFMVLHTI